MVDQMPSRQGQRTLALPHPRPSWWKMATLVRETGDHPSPTEPSPTEPLPSEPVSEISSESQKRSREELLDIYNFSLDINHNRYTLYTWCESKIQTLVTVNSVLFAALFVTSGGRITTASGLDLVLLALAVLFLASSLIIAIWHIEPKMNSKVGNLANPRTSIAIHRMTKEEYLANLMALDLATMVQHNSLQIKGMNKIIMTNQRAIRIATKLTIIGLLLFLVTIERIVF